MLAIGAAALDCPHVLGVDVDGDALEVAGCNLAAIGEDLPVRCRTPSFSAAGPCVQPNLRRVACAHRRLWGTAKWRGVGRCFKFRMRPSDMVASSGWPSALSLAS